MIRAQNETHDANLLLILYRRDEIGRSLHVDYPNAITTIGNDLRRVRTNRHTPKNLLRLALSESRDHNCILEVLTSNCCVVYICVSTTIQIKKEV